jgi:hypothetical protein
MDLYKRRLIKIKRKIDSIAKVGMDNFLEYYKYIDELINKGDLSSLQELLELEYNIDTQKYRTVIEMREKTYKIIVEQTKSDFMQKLSILYKKVRVYQQGFHIYSDVTGEIIGKLTEINVKTDDFEYYVKNKNFSRLIGEYFTFLDVEKISNGVVTSSYKEEFNNPEWTENQNLFERYKRAINFINS